MENIYTNAKVFEDTSDPVYLIELPKKTQEVIRMMRSMVKWAHPDIETVDGLSLDYMLGVVGEHVPYDFYQSLGKHVLRTTQLDLLLSNLIYTQRWSQEDLTHITRLKLQQYHQYIAEGAHTFHPPTKGDK